MLTENCMPSLNPLKYLRFLKKVARVKSKIKGKYEIGFMPLAKEIYSLLRLNMLEPHEYFIYDLARPGLSFEDKKKYLSQNQFYILDKEFNPRLQVGVLNKLVFKIYAQRYNLAVPEMYGVFDPAFGFSANNRELRTLDQLKKFIVDLPADTFVMKPISAEQARGLKVYEKIDNDNIRMLGEGEMSIAAWYDWLIEFRNTDTSVVKDAFLIEERVRQIDWLDRYATTCTQTMRIITFLNEHDEIELLGAFLKIGSEGRYIDNFGHLGVTEHQGIGSNVDFDGTLGRGVSHTLDGLRYLDEHPLTKARITGEKLPGAPEAYELARTAHSKIPQLRFLGWDIAVTKDGPKILEGNAFFGWEATQQIWGRGLLDGNLRKEAYRILKKYS